MWLSFAPIPNYTAEFYNIDVSDVDWFSIVYFIASLVVGFISIAVLDIFGLRVSVAFSLSLSATNSHTMFCRNSASQIN